jgi:hypothetical protein
VHVLIAILVVAACRCRPGSASATTVCRRAAGPIARESNRSFTNRSCVFVFDPIEACWVVGDLSALALTIDRSMANRAKTVAFFAVCSLSIMASRLHSRISQLTSSFVDSVLDAVKSSSISELLDGRPAHRAEARIPSATSVGRTAQAPAAGRLPRRSAEDIAKTLEIVVSLLGSRKNGLRAEQIRAELSMQAKELPRILKEGLNRKKLRTVGQKRATTYFVK